MRQIIVTGGAGFIGSNFVRLALSNTDHRILVVDRLTYAGNLANLPEINDPRITFRQADIADRETVRELYRESQPVAVLNFAAESHVDRSIEDPGNFVHSNILGTFEMLEAARLYLTESPDPDFRFLQVSTDEVYGSLGASGRFTESTPYAPNSPYAASKASADHLVRAYHETFGLPTLTTNCSNNYGPYQFPEKLIPLMLLNALEGRPLPIYGDGSNVRDWLFCRGSLSWTADGPRERPTRRGLQLRWRRRAHQSRGRRDPLRTARGGEAGDRQPGVGAARRRRLRGAQGVRHRPAGS